VPISLCARRIIRRSYGVVAAVALLFTTGLLAATPAGAASASSGATVATAATVPPNMDSHIVPLPWFGHQVHIHNLFWDPTGWDAHNRFSEASINDATSALVRSGYFDGLQQYGIPHPVFDGGFNSDPVCLDPTQFGAPGPNFTAVLAFMACEASQDQVNPNSTPSPLNPVVDIYNLFVPDRAVIDNQNNTKMCQDWGAEHAATVPLVFFAILPTKCVNDVGTLMSDVSHEDVETLTDPAIGLGLFDTASVKNLPNLIGLQDFFGLVGNAVVYANAVFNMNSEISDVCEPGPATSTSLGGPYSAPANFQFVPVAPFGIKMEVASYWSNADHACVAGGPGNRVVEVTLRAEGLPSGTPDVPVFGLDVPGVVNLPGVGNVVATQWTNATAATPSGVPVDPIVATETDGYAFGNVPADGVTFFPSSGGCSQDVGFPTSFPDGVPKPNTQVLDLTCLYSTTPPGLPGTGQPPNSPPVVSAGPPVTGDETGPIWLSGSVTDPDGDPLQIQWTASPPTGTTDPGASCTFADPTAPQTAITCSDEGVYNVTLTANDGVNPPVSSSTTVTVNNLGPSLSLTLPPPWQPLRAPAAVSLTAPITDPGANDTHTCTINWDDGTTETFAQEGTCDRTHTYTAPGVYTINVTVTDDDQRTASASGIVVVFDPGAGFVTGGGYINSPPGAYTPDTTVAGKAHFVMQASYPDGTSTPTGNVSVFLQDIKLRMDATSLDWLVVSPDGEAAVTGSGTMGGQDVRFILYGYQGCGSSSGTGCQPGSDAFRAVIWPASQGVTPTAPFIYDNVPGADLELADATPQPLDGGNIQIHS